mgnify:CR=1 FL=1
MRVVLTPEDLKSGELAATGWNPMEVVNYEEKEAGENAKNPGSTNCIWTFKILDGESKGIEVSKLINENPKSLGHVSNRSLWNTFGFPKTTVGGYELSSELFEKTVGFKLMGYIKRGKSNQGNEFNDLVDFKPMG